MINESIEELFNSINNSDEYKEYLKMQKDLYNNRELMDLIEEIKSLEKKAVKLEYSGDDKYKEVDKEIEKNTKELNANAYYAEYLSKLNKFNAALLTSSSLIEEYINDKVTI